MATKIIELPQITTTDNEDQILVYDSKTQALSRINADDLVASVGHGSVQSDWSELDASKPAFIKNKQVVSNSITALDTQVVDLGTKTTNLITALGDVKKDVADNKAEIDALETKSTGYDKDLKDLETKLTTTDTQATTALAKATACESKVASVERVQVRHEGEITTLTGKQGTIEGLLDDNTKAIVSLKASKVDGLTATVNDQAKTITLVLTSGSSTIDTDIIDLSSWFGVSPPTTDHEFFFGFSIRTVVDESNILNGQSATAPSINGYDVVSTRNSSNSSYMWIWIPDVFGAIKGFNFSGFLSVWAGTPVLVASIPGKLYVSPNTTTAKIIKYEVTQ
ncbi:hypothetical protein [Pseudoalteromonas phage vB_PtuP_Slicky01]|nr:hypothetical protein [Pseudoalteromonas phage vB_PtuP_Slicky01]